MDPQRFREAYERLQLVDERLTYRVRPRNLSGSRPSVEQIDDRLRDLAQLTIELKEILAELFVAIGTQPPAAAQRPEEPNPP